MTPTNNLISIIAGPCSVDHYNIQEVLEIAKMQVTNRQGKTQKAVTGTRIVGMKSRTNLNPEKEWLGCDYQQVCQNLQRIAEGTSINDLSPHPSAELTRRVLEETHLMVATEVIIPSIQMPVLSRAVEHLNTAGRIMVWNPSVNQLGGQVLELAQYAKKNQWKIGLKNGKWLGEEYEIVENADFKELTSMEKTWLGLHSYAKGAQEIVMIHRGCDIPDKNNYRNVPVHYAASRVKNASKSSMLYDPSHIHGPKKRDEIVQKTVEAMKLKNLDGDYLYDGVLVEVGTAKSDTDQHLSLRELHTLCQQLAEFRDIKVD